MYRKTAYGYIYFGIEFYRIYNKITLDQLMIKNRVDEILLERYNLKHLIQLPDTKLPNQNVYQSVENPEYKDIAKLLHELDQSVEGFNTLNKHYITKNLIALDIFTPHMGLNIYEYENDIYILPVWSFKIMFV